MTGKATYIIKMVLVVLLILVTPAIFFGSVGDNPMKVERTASRVIAVVNEDTGMEKEDKALEFGKEISTIFDENSRYEWTVIGRSAAINGLKDSRYDAVVFIPSNFSTNIMTYESMQPVKANFEYTVQDQLNAVDRERVLREIEKATGRVNSRISTLYWTYVSQDLENVRAHFDTILQKEVDFQNAMLAFYKPTSLNLANEIERQRSMLENLQSTVATVSEEAPGRENNVQQFEQNLTSFVQFVEEFKEYQNNQQEVLQQLQDESISSIQLLATAQPTRHAEVQDYLSQEGRGINAGLASIARSMDQNNGTLEDLSEIRRFEMGTQKEELLSDLFDYTIDIQIAQQNSELSNIKTTILELKDELSKGKGSPGNPEDPDRVTTSATKRTQVNQIGESPGESKKFEREIIELEEIIQSLSDVEEKLNTVTPIPDYVMSAIEDFGPIEEKIIDIRDRLISYEEEDNPLIKELLSTITELEQEVNQLLTDKEYLEEVIKQLEGERDTLTSNLQSIKKEIIRKEENIKNLDEFKDKDLRETFDIKINNNDTKTLLTYYSSLVQYEKTLTRNIYDDEEEIKSIIEQVVKVSNEEQKKWDILSVALPTNMSDMQALQDNFTTFMKEYSANIEEQQSSIMNDISSLEVSANSVMEQVRLFAANEPTPAEGNDGNTVVNRQQTISQELLTLNDLVSSVEESQSNIVSYTTELQTNVESVQSDADTLNAKWAENVDATRMYRDDIFNVLGNAYVDGQKNGPVYDHLANPLQISGDAATGAEDNRIPPVVVLAIILISSLLIGYFSHYFNNAPILVQGSMFILLNIIVGLIISLYGLNIYPLAEDRAIQWSIFTILLLTAASAVVLTGFSIGKLVGWIASVGLVIFFISPFISLTAPNINYEDPMSRVYMSIQYGSSSLFMGAVITLIVLLLLLLVIPQLVKLIKSNREKKNEDEAYEV